MPIARNGKPRRSLLASAFVGASLVAAILALAPPPGRTAHAAPLEGPRAGAARKPGSVRPKMQAPDAAGDDGGAASGGGVDGSPASSPPAAPPVLAGDGGRLSPLNPAPDEFSDAAVPRSVDYDRLLSDIAALRARVAAVSDTLFHSRLAIAVEIAGDRAKLASLRVSLDDGVVWTSPASFRPDAKTIVYEHAVAPGHHAVTVDIERRDEHRDVFRSSQQSRLVVEVPADRRLAVDIALNDDSNMGSEFPSSLEGRYDLRVQLRARAEAASR